MIVALFLEGFEYKLVDAQGNYPKNPPIPDINDLQRVNHLNFSFLSFIDSNLISRQALSANRSSCNTNA